MAGTVYLVGTPIGNLGDLSPRAAETLAAVDFIAAEDTRVARALLTHLGIKKPLLSYHAHNQRDSGSQIIARVLAGESCALVTDAGMPCVCDPGEALMRECREAGCPTAAVPGPTAAMTALALSGLPSSRFVFEGFLTVNRTGRRERLAALATEERTLLFYEAPHKLRATLRDMAEAFGGERVIVLCRELTKIFEETRRCTLAQARALYADNEEPRGEFVLVVAGAEPAMPERVTPEAAAALAQRLRAEQGLSASAAAKAAAAQTGVPKSEIYRASTKMER